MDFQLEDRTYETLFFDFQVTSSQGTEIVGTGQFEPDGVNGMVDHPHLVGFGIADFDSGGVGVVTRGHRDVVELEVG